MTPTQLRNYFFSIPQDTTHDETTSKCTGS